MEILGTHKSRFGKDFTDNKKTLDEISIIRSKGLKNEIAGYITKFIKREIRDKEIHEELISKQSQISEEITEPVIPTDSQGNDPVETDATSN